MVEGLFMSVKYFVISLKNQEARRKNICSILKQHKVDFELFDATYGKDMTPEEQSLCSNESQTILNLKGNRKVLIEDELSLSEKGCAMSHLRLYQHIIDQNLDYAVIMEDDLVPPSDVFEIVKKIDLIKEPWDVVNFSDNYGIRSLMGAKKYYFDNDKTEYFQRVGFRNETLDAIFNLRRFIICAACYVITKDTCKKLIELGYPVRLPADYLLGMIGYNNLKTFIVHSRKNLLQFLEADSNIGNRPGHKMVRL